VTITDSSVGMIWTTWTGFVDIHCLLPLHAPLPLVQIYMTNINRTLYKTAGDDRDKGLDKP
jgi:hypothetical protein